MLHRQALTRRHANQIDAAARTMGWNYCFDSMSPDIVFWKQSKDSFQNSWLLCVVRRELLTGFTVSSPLTLITSMMSTAMIELWDRRGTAEVKTYYG